MTSGILLGAPGAVLAAIAFGMVFRGGRARAAALDAEEPAVLMARTPAEIKIHAARPYQRHIRHVIEELPDAPPLDFDVDEYIKTMCERAADDRRERAMRLRRLSHLYQDERNQPG